jgi:hypothetical protein
MASFKELYTVPRSAAVVAAAAAVAKGQIAGNSENPKKSKKIGKN